MPAADESVGKGNGNGKDLVPVAITVIGFGVGLVVGAAAAILIPSFREEGRSVRKDEEVLYL